MSSKGGGESKSPSGEIIENFSQFAILDQESGEEKNITEIIDWIPRTTVLTPGNFYEFLIVSQEYERNVFMNRRGQEVRYIGKSQVRVANHSKIFHIFEGLSEIEEPEFLLFTGNVLPCQLGVFGFNLNQNSWVNFQEILVVVTQLDREPDRADLRSVKAQFEENIASPNLHRSLLPLLYLNAFRKFLALIQEGSDFITLDFESYRKAAELMQEIERFTPRRSLIFSVISKAKKHLERERTRLAKLLRDIIRLDTTCKEGNNPLFNVLDVTGSDVCAYFVGGNPPRGSDREAWAAWKQTQKDMLKFRMKKSRKRKNRRRKKKSRRRRSRKKR